MFSIELKSKGKVFIDLDLITVADVRGLSKNTKTATGDEILAKAAGMEVSDLEKLPFREYRKLTKFFWECLTNPLKDEDEVKNSQSESTSG